MQRRTIAKLRRSFEDAKTEFEGVEAWYARDLQKLLDYDEWRNFLNVVERARTSCEQAGQDPENHFVGVNKMVQIGSGGEREVADILLTRYGCYLLAQNGHPNKEPVAFAQAYFALQTRKQELLEERLALHERLEARNKLTKTEKELSSLIYQRGVDQKGFGIIRSKGDQALFGGHTTKTMKQVLKIPANRALADFLPTVTIKAKDLAAEMTNHNVKNSSVYGHENISNLHVGNNENVREALTKSGIYPEKLPPEEDIKKLERRFASEEKKLSKSVQNLPKAKDS